MKKLLGILLLVTGLAQAQIQHTQTVNTIAELKLKPIGASNVTIVLSQTALGDGGGGFYYFDIADNTSVEDAVYWNVIKSSVSATGCWKRNFVRTIAYPGGTLSLNGGEKRYYWTGTTDSNGQITVNLTRENTSNGTGLFVDLRLTLCQPVTVPSSTSNAVNFYVLSGGSGASKTITLQFYRGNTGVLSLMGLNLIPFTAVASGTQVSGVSQGF